jgi:hypothetical protein
VAIALPTVVEGVPVPDQRTASLLLGASAGGTEQQDQRPPSPSSAPEAPSMHASARALPLHAETFSAPGAGASRNVGPTTAQHAGVAPNAEPPPSRWPTAGGLGAARQPIYPSTGGLGAAWQPNYPSADGSADAAELAPGLNGVSTYAQAPQGG